LKSRAIGNIPLGWRSSLFFRTVFALSLLVSATVGLPGQDSSSPSDSDNLFTHAVQDYEQNRFSEAGTEFEKVRGVHAQDAQHYLSRIKAYKEDMDIAATIMKRSPDELDVTSLEYAIQKYQDALRIKKDGPWDPEQRLQTAMALHAKLQQQGSKGMEARDRDICGKAVGAVQQHHFKDAALYSCLLANDNPAYSCNGDEAVHMCQQMRELAPLGGSLVEDHPPTHSSTGTSASSGTGAFDKGKAAFERNDFEKARILFAHAPAELKSAADEYLTKISRYQAFMAQAEKLSQSSSYDEARVAFTNAANIKPDGPGNPRAQALLMELEEGIDQFYSGDYVSAMHNLEGYSRDSTEREPLAHFYLGASKLARFFITGSEDASLQQDALHDLRIAKQAGYKANGQDVSPRILKAYNDLAF
jgi:tetratricopeptide (TPR) repeat protein